MHCDRDDSNAYSFDFLKNLSINVYTYLVVDKDLFCSPLQIYFFIK
jgi:hypothetical protein